MGATVSPRLRRFLYGSMLTVSLVFLCIVAGALIGRLDSSGMGWDQLASILGGMMIGGIAGLLAGVVLSLNMSMKSLVRGSIGCLTIAVLSWGALALWSQSNAADDATEALALPTSPEPTSSEAKPTPPASPVDRPTEPTPPVADPTEPAVPAIPPRD